MSYLKNTFHPQENNHKAVKEKKWIAYRPSASAAPPGVNDLMNILNFCSPDEVSTPEPTMLIPRPFTPLRKSISNISISSRCFSNSYSAEADNGSISSFLRL
ncbi:unnamed protein product [Schistosoma mattheei]|uniref:Uncharacterized protein n=1 Tax=Schistosoma mattheei TaxID=31246 RepID=A0A183PF64_9TREM|nr:unnamed protein product [Schistosoma mattheei]